MLPVLQIRQQWSPWWIAAPMLIVYFGFGWVLLRDFSQAGQAVRIILPAFVLFGAIVLPAALNARIITVGPEGVRVVNGPLPKGRNVFVAREDIRSSSIRTQYATFASRSGGTARIKHYLVGVETKTGHIDIAYPYLRLDDAKVVAQKIATAIGGAEVTATTNLPAVWGKSQKSWRLKVLLWGGLFILAILAGAFWEIRSMHPTMR